MKSRIKYISSLCNVLLIATLITTISACNKCKDVECDNEGICEKGICECTERVTDDFCSLQRQPKSITMTRVQISDVEFYVNREWDEDGSRPDVQLGIQKGRDVFLSFISNERFDNSPSSEFTFEDELKFDVANQSETYRFSLLDYDDGSYQEIFWCTANLYHSSNGLPDVFEYEYDAGVKLKVWLEYEF